MNLIHMPLLAADQGPEIENLLHALLAARAASVNAGNRRALYARMDALLAAGADPLPIGPLINALPEGGEAVRLTRMRLRNWKAFERADLDIPQPRDERALVIIGGSNGFGKSSIIEAFAFALFGRRALSDVGFLIDAAGGRRAQRRSYRSFLERALHRSDRARADGMCSVALDFETAEGAIAVERKWYFDEQGTLIEEDEELVIRIGADRQPLDLPADVVPREWYQAEIERRIMPASLAPFFLFDGEQVERWADRQLSDQVRMAISNMLGLEELGGLAEDLRAYTRDRERSLGSDSSLAADALTVEIDCLEQELAQEEAALRTIEATIQDRRADRNAALTKLAAIGTASHAELQGRLEAEHRLTADRHRLKRELLGRIADLGPLLLVGAHLLDRLEQGIEADARAALSSGIDPEAAELLWQRFVGLEPPLEADLAASLRDRFLGSCSPQGEHLATPKRHPHLDRQGRRGIRAILQKVGQHGRDRLRDAKSALEQVDDQLVQLKAAERRETEEASLRAAIQSELATITREIEQGEQKRGAIARHIDALTAQVGPKRAEHDRRTEAMRDAEPRLHAAAAARTLASMIDAHMAGLADQEYERFAAAVTDCFQSLAHKKQIARIEIGAAGAIALFDAAGRDITDYRLSAGESQLFAMALIGAVGRLVGDRLPLIVDTPLGRLDTGHRQSVLALLAGRRSQTILLTQPEELNAAHLAILRPVLAGSTHIAHQIDPATGIGVSTIAAERDASADPI